MNRTTDRVALSINVETVIHASTKTKSGGKINLKSLLEHLVTKKAFTLTELSLIGLQVRLNDMYFLELHFSIRAS